jgi:DNA-binding beta-propeller fold protein YncE
MKRNLCIGATFLALIVALQIGSTVVKKRATVEAATVQAPIFEVDPFWPKPLPNKWILGQVIGLSVDSNDHIWMIQRSGTPEANELHAARKVGPTGDLLPQVAQCCIQGPPVMEYDEAGNLIGHWGGPGPGYDWPSSEHGITVDYKGNVWLGGNGNVRRGAAGVPAEAEQGEGGAAYSGKKAEDDFILKFTQDGKFLMQIGKPNQSKGSNDPDNLKAPAKEFIDKETNELYVADGYGNHRVIVFDADTGKYKRHWGAYGHVPDDTPPKAYVPSDPPDQQFRNPVHCVNISVDRLVYVCDRENDRMQVFHTDGTFVKEAYFDKDTLGSGSVWEAVFSKDPEQKYIYLTDGENRHVRIIDRQSLTVLTQFGEGGRQPGQFYGVHSIGVDSKGNIFTAETYRGQRIQKFIYKGIGPVTKFDQGVVWPKTASSPPLN